MGNRDLLGYTGKRVVFTGGSTGIGKAAAEILVDLGAEVYSLGTRGTAVPGFPDRLFPLQQIGKKRHPLKLSESYHYGDADV